MSSIATIRNSLKAIDDYCFGPASPTPLGIFRIFIGSLAFINLLMISVDWDAWFTERGYVPAWVGKRALGGDVSLWPSLHVLIPRINLIGGVTNPSLALAFYVLVTLFALTTALGLWTRFSSIALAVGIVSLHHRNLLILHGGDTVLRVLVLYLAISPCGRACSIDRLIRLWKGKDSGAPIVVSAWSQRLIMYNMALIYFTTTWLKWYGSLWRNGTATWYTARLPEFYRFPVPSFLNGALFVKVTTYGTLVAEFALATLVFYKPARKYVFALGILVHGWIEYSMNIPLFGYLMVSMYIVFYDGDEIQGWAEKVGKRLSRFAATIRLPNEKRLDPRGVAFFDAADPFKFLTYLPGDADAIIKEDLKRSRNRSVGAWVFSWVPNVWATLLESSLDDEPMPERRNPKERAGTHRR